MREKKKMEKRIMKENKEIRKKKTEERIKKIIIQLSDGSVFCVDDKNKLSALKMKLKIDDISTDEFISIFIKRIEKHWKNKTLPTKFPWDINWKEHFEEIIDMKRYVNQKITKKDKLKIKFKNQAELAEEVFYQYVRAYLMGILLSKASEGKVGSTVTGEDDSSASISFVKEDNLIHKKFKKQEKEEKTE